MADAWPATLPQYLERDGYQEDQAENTVRSSMETGPGKVRRRSTAGPGKLSGVMKLSTAQMVTLFGSDRKSGFYGTTLLSGSLTFTMPDPWGGDPLLLRFTEPPMWSAVGGGFWTVRLSLEVMP